MSSLINISSLVSVKKLLHYRAGGLLQYRAVLLHYRAVITLSGIFYYIIGQLLQYRVFITLSVGTGVANVEMEMATWRKLTWKTAR